jgi:hypothetical protein
MRRFLVFTFALSACASPMSAPVAAVRTAAPRAEPSFALSRFELSETSPATSFSACAIGPSELECQTKLVASLRARSAASEPVAANEVLSITGEDGAVLFAQALRTGVSQARLRSSLPVTARK